MISNDVQKARIQIPRAGGQPPVWLRVEAALELDDFFVVAGWRSEPIEVEVRSGGVVLDVDTYLRPRNDVAASLDLKSGDDLGFAIVGRAPKGDRIDIAWREPMATRMPITLTQFDEFEGGKLPLPDSEVLRVSRSLPIFGDDWRRVVVGTTGRRPRTGEAVGNVEFAVANPQARDGIVSGWCLTGQHSMVTWVETSSGEVTALSAATPRERQDVVEAFAGSYPGGDRQPGFALRVPGVVKGDVVRLRAQTEDGVVDLSEGTVAELPHDPVRAAETIFGLSAPSPNRFAGYVGQIALPALGGMIESRRDEWTRQSILVREYGNLHERPRVSIVVPLYGRTDFVEHQLIEFARDEWLLDHAELVYVVDDPQILDKCITDAAGLHNLYGVPFRLVWGGVNRGYSGANNLGAEHSRGDLLLFLNSDAIPQKPGWLESLVGSLEEHPDIGAVAPRLVFGDGSIQHAGMTFRQRADLGVWVNHHPHMGLDPELDPAAGQDVDVPAVTGACLLVRREDFDAIEGWDTGYLIGDFEDSDFCLKLRSNGKRIIYSPAVQLTHLERQSFALLGDSSFRLKVVIYNAHRHQSRWGTMLEELADAR
ncbi:glycosyltransferase family 2 protein [Isoptericola sp. NPDC056605]|uniref:glycosyltransferase family 2 protein n=1 Tax=Isoptericola sp. NPDC056605 TaxID=3345876 RepID=UPI0036A21947